MITIILFALIFAVIFVMADDFDFWSIWENMVFTTLRFASGALLGIILGLPIALLLPVKDQEVLYVSNLETLQDGNNVSGSFFLGCGTIDGKMQYVYYYESSDGYRMNQIDYDKVVIKYSTDTPRIETYKMEPIKGKFINNFALDTPKERNIIYVPKGTIKQNFSLDAQ